MELRHVVNWFTFQGVGVCAMANENRVIRGVRMG